MEPDARRAMRTAQWHYDTYIHCFGIADDSRAYLETPNPMHWFICITYRHTKGSIGDVRLGLGSR